MASANTSFSENFSCSICLDVFDSPVTTACGHNFCRICITQFWDEQVRYKCPLCNELFHTRPDLRVNILLSETIDQFRTSVRVKEQPCVKPREVPCDFCTGTQLKAVKSCLVCLSSYCQTHLEQHHRVAGLKKHRLVEPKDRDVDVTLDPDTAHPELVPSEDGKRVHHRRGPALPMATVDIENPMNNIMHSPKREKGGKRKTLTKAGIGTPRNFQHIGHIGWDSNTGFDLNNLDPELKHLFDMCGISEAQLKDKETSKVIYEFIEKKGGVEAVKKELRRQAPPPHPSRGGPPQPPPSHPGSAPPPPPHSAPPPAAPSRGPSSAPPLPPP
ncbi:unnamed protein product [Gadus morhua 'NCC']